MKYLSHTADEIDEKLKRIPIATFSEAPWTRTEDWIHIADQEFKADSKFAQSGVAIAAALLNFVSKSEAITDKEIIALFNE